MINFGIIRYDLFEKMSEWEKLGVLLRVIKEQTWYRMFIYEEFETHPYPLWHFIDYLNYEKFLDVLYDFLENNKFI